MNILAFVLEYTPPKVIFYDFHHATNRRMLWCVPRKSSLYMIVLKTFFYVHIQ